MKRTATPITYRGLLAWPQVTEQLPEGLERLAAGLGAPIPVAYLRFASAVAKFALPYSVLLGGRPYVFSVDSFARIAANQNHLAQAWFRDQLPSSAVSIGTTGGEDDTLFLEFGGANHGRVLAWTSARSQRRSDAAPRRDALHVVADDFDAYLARLVLLDRDLGAKRNDPAFMAWFARATQERIADWGLVWRGQTSNS
jgi:hypothetical protein